MTDRAQTTTTSLVAGTTAYRITVDVIDWREPMGVTVVGSNGAEWSSPSEAACRGVSYGVFGETVVLWTARKLIVLPTDPTSEPALIDVDEDVLFVFSVPDAWLVICETSVRILRDGHTTARVELPEVVEQARWTPPQLSVECPGGDRFRFEVSGDGRDLVDG